MRKILFILLSLIILIGAGVAAYWQTGKNLKPVITIVSPNGGEVFQEGSVYTIKWETKNIPETDKISISIRRVPPPVLQEEGQEFDPLVFVNLENIGSVDWKISDMYPEGNYVLGITAYKSVPVINPISDESDAVFKIISSPAIKTNYACDGNKTISAEFIEGEVQSAVQPGEPPIPTGGVKIDLSDGRAFDLPRTISASGIRYANPDESFVFWSKGDGAFIVENNKETYSNCVVGSKQDMALFSNSDGKYNFEYPSVWKAAVNQYVKGNSLFGPDADGASGLGGVEIFPNQSSIDGFLEGVSAEYSDKKNIIIGGVSGIRVRYKGFPASGEQAVFLKDGKIYNIYVNSEKAEDIEFFDLIVSSFELAP